MMKGSHKVMIGATSTGCGTAQRTVADWPHLSWAYASCIMTHDAGLARGESMALSLAGSRGGQCILP